MRNTFAMVQEQSYSTGGSGPREHFIVPGSGQLGESLNGIRASFETPCGAYAHFKITQYLLRITRDSRYGDSMERVMYDTVFGAKPIQPEGSAFYYSDYTFNASKGYFHSKWPCCLGTLPQIAEDYRIFPGTDHQLPIRQ
ncbi:MAG TPA: beta-L-arabinofuranosidase domain-containing protein, partial [Acidobacteriaceae bacterium]|nr:beta-L-arabinofuranosidase domain-containing protein [Acidobacteriaceae bacterium]